ncbi:MAG: DUF6531 domain-containing protein [Anaerolineae bacterium]
MRASRWYISLLWIVLLWAIPLAAQTNNIHSLSYGERVGGRFVNADETMQSWYFEGVTGEIVAVRVARIGGIFVPRLRLIAPDGQPVRVLDDTRDEHNHEILISDGLPQTGTYRIEITQQSAASDGVLTQSEYSLLLEQRGQMITDASALLERPLPELDADTLPDYFTGTPTTSFLNIEVYGDATRTDPFTLTGVRRVIVDNSNVVARVISDVAVVDATGEIALRSRDGAVLVTENDIERLSVDSAVVTLRLDDRRTFSTDFYDVSSIRIGAEAVVVRLRDGQRLLLSGDRVSLTRRGGISGEGPNAEPIHVVSVDETTLITDGDGWQTLAQIDGQLIVLYESGFALVSDARSGSLLRRGNRIRPELNAPLIDTRLFDVRLDDLQGQVLTLTLDPAGLETVRVAPDEVGVRFIDGREASESRPDLRDLIIDDGALRFERMDGTMSTLLPDNTRFLMPTTPYILPQNFANWGTTISDYFPQLDFDFALMPINRANGNFIYPVQDDAVADTAPALEWSRTYNSLAPHNQTPDYMRDAPHYAQLGQGWRHAYQIELDVRRAPVGEVRIILADGSVHGFTQQEDGAFRSMNLRSWRVERPRGLTGNWVAYTASGIQYHFDYAGRLIRISTVQGQVLIIEPLPTSYLEAFDASNGFAVLEPYGRRIEIYADDARQIIAMRGVQGRVTRYTYDDGQLVNVDYVGEDYRASYRYEDAGMVALDDVNSPYARQMTIEYNAQEQVSAYTDYATGDLPQRYELSYEASASEQMWRVRGGDGDDTQRTMRWVYDDQTRLIRWVLPDPAWVYQWRYAQDNGRLTEIVQPTRTILRLNYDQYGYLTHFTDPLFGSGTGSYRLHYTEGARFTRLLTAVDTPSINNWLTFDYDERNQLIALTRALSGSGVDRQSHSTRYSYNARGELRQIIEPVATDDAFRVTDYTYDSFGYPRLIRQGSMQAIDTNTPDHVWRVQHDGVGRLLSTTDTAGQITSVQWHPDRELIESITQGSDTYRYQYDAYDNLMRYDTPISTERYRYDAQDRLIARIDALNRLTAYQYDSAGNLLAIITPDARQALRYQYNVLDQLIAQTDGDGFTTRYETALDTVSNRINYHIINALGERTSYIHDTLGRLRQVIDADRNGSETYRYLLTYNARGNLIALNDNLGQGRTLTYDFASNLLTTTLNDVATTTYSYDDGLRLTNVADPGGAITRYTYDRYDNIISATLPTGTNYSYDYDNLGRLIHVIDPNDNSTRYLYDADRSAITVRLASDDQVIYQYDEAGNLIAVTDPRDSNNRTEYQYDDLNRLMGVITPSGAITRYEYNASDLLTRIIAPNDLQTSLTYDLSGRIVARVQPDEREVLYERDALGRIISTTNPSGQTTLYAYNVIGEIGRITNPNGQSEFFSWFSNGRIARYAGSSGIEYEYLYDPVGRLVEIVDLGVDEGIAINTRYDYDSAGRIVGVRQGTRTTITTEEAIVHRYGYDEQGNLISYQAPESATPYQMQYDNNGNRIALTDPQGITTRYQYDEHDNVSAITHASGTPDEITEQFIYDSAGNLTRSLTIDGVERLYSYDASNRLIAVTERASPIETRTHRFTYNSIGRVNSITTPDGQVTAYRYDLFGNLVAIEQTRPTENGDPQILTTRYQYDAFDNLTSVQAPAGQTHTMTYVGAGRRVRYVDARGNTWSYSYDELGNIEQVSNPLGYTQFFGYDLANRLVQQTNELGAVTRFSYDVRGHLSQVTLPPTDNREQVGYQFDRAGQLIGITHGTDNRQTWTRDALGQITAITNANENTFTIAYDERGRVVTLTTDTLEIDRTYDANGQLASLNDGETQITLAYDGYSQLTQFMLGADSDDEDTPADLIARYRYDENGNLIERDAGVYGALAIAYDAFSRPTEIAFGEQWVRITYDENGWRTGLIRSNGIETRYSYDRNGRVRTIIHLNAEQVRLVGFAYEYDSIGNLIRLTRSDNWSKLYSYDNARQLISERWLDENNQIIYSVNYTYDEAGNRVEKIEQIGRSNQTRTLYEYNDQNQLVAEFQDVGFELEDRFSLPVAFPFMIVLGAPMWRLVRRRHRWLIVLGIGALFMMPLLQSAQTPTISYEYDSAGNLSAEVHQDGSVTRYQYDALNRLLAVERETSLGESLDLTQIRYNPQGRVAEVIEGDQHQRLLYDAFGLVAVQDIVSEQVTVHLAPTPDETLLVIQDARVFWTLDDGLGQVNRFVADDHTSFDTEVGFSTNAFQQVIISDARTSADTPSRDLIEQIYLSQSELILMGVRAYHPRIGRFLQRDWVRHDPQGNLYTFAYNSPTHYTDRTGMTPDSAFDSMIPEIAQVQPSDFIVEPIMLDFSASSVADQQAQENHRIVQLAYLTEYHNNQTTLIVDQNACELYLHSANSIPADALAQLGASRQAMRDVYHPERGWMPPEQPHLASNRPDLAPFDQMWVMLARAQQSGVAFGGCPPANPRPQMPEFAPAHRFDQLRNIREQLNEVPMLAVTRPSEEAIAPIESQQLIPAVTLNTPQLSASFPTMGRQVDQLRAETGAFFSELLLPQLAPEPFRWQQLYQAQSVMPAYAIDITR